MVEDITEKKKSEESLRDSEERMRLAQQAARMGAFEWNIQTGLNVWTPELEAIYGLPPGGFAGTQAAFENLIYAEDRERVLGLVDSALKSGKATRGEWRVVWPDGSLHWIVGRWQVFMNESGEPERMIGVNLDVTERKLAEQALADVTRKLIEAQEQERARIGRELHDDINQRLAMLAIELEQLLLDPSHSQSRLPELRDQVVEISSDVQNLSHELHSSKLEYLGVVAGIRSWCQEFAERHRVEIDFRSDVEGVLPFEVGVCLLRVLQEAVHNSIKHSGVKRMEVQLAGDSNRVHLAISDAGKGFDKETALQGKGLGLISMRERVRLLNGSITFHSRPMEGTRIHVCVPLSAEASSARAVGQ
jgi:PAS domain S-box-containing protein